MGTRFLVFNDLARSESMKIERISDNQIRCTLSHQDLEDRELKLSELAYGTDKAKELFRDMMQQASYQFGFEADDIPLMIEAIPISRETLILIITKVEDPDELDTRFSKFSPEASTSSDEDEYYQDDDEAFSDKLFDTCGHIADLLKATGDIDDITGDEEYDDSEEEDYSGQHHDVEFVPLAETLGFGNNKQEDTNTNISDIIRIFSFESLDQVTRFASHITSMYNGENTVYKDDNSRYYLVMHRSSHTPEEFNRVCNLASEYGRVERSTYATASHYDEHFTALVRTKAIQVLSNL